MKRIILMLLMIVTATIFCETVQAQPSKQVQADKRRLNREELATKQAEQIATALAFDKTTSKKFIDTYCRYCKEIWEARATKISHKGSTRSDEEVEQTIKAQFERSRKILDIREKFYNEYRKFLTPKQIQSVYNQERKIMNHLQNRWKGAHAHPPTNRLNFSSQPDYLKYKPIFDQINNNDSD